MMMDGSHSMPRLPSSFHATRHGQVNVSGETSKKAAKEAKQTYC